MQRGMDDAKISSLCGAYSTCVIKRPSSSSNQKLSSVPETLAVSVSQSVSQSSGHEFRDESRLTNGCPSIYPSVRRHFFYGDISIFISKPPFNAFPLWGSHPLSKAWRGYRILMVLIGTNRPHAGLYSFEALLVLVLTVPPTISLTQNLG